MLFDEKVHEYGNMPSSIIYIPIPFSSYYGIFKPLLLLRWKLSTRGELTTDSDRMQSMQLERIQQSSTTRELFT